MPKVILLGSADTLVTNPRGHIIDDFDIIWRTNHTGHPKALTTYPEILGSSYSNWYVHDLPYSVFTATDGKMIPNTMIEKYQMILHNLFDVEIEQLKRVGVTKTSSNAFLGIYKRCNKQEIFDLQENKIINSNLLFDSPFDNLYFGHLNWLKDVYDQLHINGLSLKRPPIQKPSSGLRILVYLLNKYDHVDLMGFNGGKTGHWYTNKKIKLNYTSNSDHITTQQNRFGVGGKNGIAKHHLDLEYQFIKLMENQGRVTIHE